MIESSLDQFAFSGEVGRINPEEKILEAKIPCPQIKFNGKTNGRPTMALEVCILRVQTKNLSCLTKCVYAKQIKVYIDTGAWDVS